MMSSVIEWNSRTKELGPFLFYKNSGVSIVTLQKQETLVGVQFLLNLVQATYFPSSIILDDIL